MGTCRRRSTGPAGPLQVPVLEGRYGSSVFRMPYTKRRSPTSTARGRALGAVLDTPTGSVADHGRCDGLTAAAHGRPILPATDAEVPAHSSSSLQVFRGRDPRRSLPRAPRPLRHQARASAVRSPTSSRARDHPAASPFFFLSLRNRPSSLLAFLPRCCLVMNKPSPAARPSLLPSPRSRRVTQWFSGGGAGPLVSLGCAHEPCTRPGCRSRSQVRRPRASAAVIALRHRPASPGLRTPPGSSGGCDTHVLISLRRAPGPTLPRLPVPGTCGPPFLAVPGKVRSRHPRSRRGQETHSLLHRHRAGGQGH